MDSQVGQSAVSILASCRGRLQVSFCISSVSRLHTANAKGKGSNAERT